MESSDPRVSSRLADLAGWTAGSADRGPDRATPGHEPVRAVGDEWEDPQGPTRDGSVVTASAPSADLRGRALGAALATYTAAHGHPLDHSGQGPRRWATSLRVATAACLAIAASTAGVVVWRVQAEPPSTLVPTSAAEHEQPTGPLPDAGAGSPDPGPASTSGPGPAPVGTAAPEVDVVVVHVVGQVEAPGLVELPVGARVADAVTAAGGAAPEAEMSGLNLARALVDGEQIRVPDAAQAAASPDPSGAHGGDGSTSSGPAGTVDLNAADVAALDALPGIGPVLAERIVTWRDDHGRFTSVDELTEVAGIGPALLGRLRDQVHVG